MLHLGHGAAGCELPGVRPSTLLVTVQGLSHRKDIVRARIVLGEQAAQRRIVLPLNEAVFSSSRGWALPACLGCGLAGDAVLPGLLGLFSASEVVHWHSQQHKYMP